MTGRSDASTQELTRLRLKIDDEVIFTPHRYGDTTYYHAGDTDFLPAMYGIRCDVAFLPVGGHYTMGVDEAAKAAEACGAEVLVPIHWGEPHGTEEDIERLQALFPRTVSVLERTG